MNDIDARLSAVKQAIKEKTKEKQLCARDFRAVDKQSAEFDALKSRMSDIAAALKQLEADRKTLNKNKNESQATNPEDLKPAISQRYNAMVIDQCKVSFIEEAQPEQASVWDSYVREHPNASPYHLFRWQRIIQSSFGHQSSYLLAFSKDKKVIGVLPITWQSSKLFGNRAISVPYLNYGGPLTNNPQIAQELVAYAATLAQDRSYNSLELRTTSDGFPLPSQKHKVSMILRLPESVAQLEKQIGSKIRAQINQAKKHTLSFKIGGENLIDDFYSVFSTNMRDLGTPVYGKSFFQKIFDDLGSLCRLVVVYVDGKAISTAFLIGYKEVLEIPWASTLKKANQYNANMFLYFQVLNFAINEGYGYFDFGRSSPDAGTYRFKKQWGALPVQHHWYYWLKDDEEVPSLNPNNPKFQMMIAIWKQLPLFIANKLGPLVAKDLP